MKNKLYNTCVLGLLLSSLLILACNSQQVDTGTKNANEESSELKNENSSENDKMGDQDNYSGGYKDTTKRPQLQP